MSNLEQIQSELKKLEKEIIETRNMNIKTDNNMRSLFAELKKVSGNQETSARKARIGHIGLYILFVLIFTVGGIVLSELRASLLEEKIEGLKTQIVVLKEENEASKTELQARDSAEKRSLHLIKLLEEKKRAEAVKEFNKIDRSKLSKAEVLLLEEKVKVFRMDLARKHYDQGVNQWRIGGDKSAVQELNVSLDYYKDPEYEGMLHYYLGLSLIRMKKLDEGIEHLKTALTLKLDKETADKIYIKISDTYNDASRYDESLRYMQSIPQNDMGYWTRQAINMKITWVKKQLAAQKKQTEAQ